MNLECACCGGLVFAAENQGSANNVYFGKLCCNQGKVKGIRDYKLPPCLESLYTSDSTEAEYFRKNVRSFNNGMAMSSLVCEKGWKNRAHNNKINLMLTASGQLFRRVGPLTAAEGETSKCVQTCFYGGEQATAWHMENIRKKIEDGERAMCRKIFKDLHKVMTQDSNNKYLKSFIGAKRYVEKHLKNKIWDVNIAIHANESSRKLAHAGRLNVPTVNEAAILMPNDNGITKHHDRSVLILSLPCIGALFAGQAKP